jgi:hypothetical protein
MIKIPKMLKKLKRGELNGSKFLLGFIILLWIFSLGFGLGKLMEYSTTPGSVGDVAESWPKETKLKLSNRNFTLVLALHPHCPCSMATVAELNKIIGWAQGKIVVKVLTVKTGHLSTEEIGDEALIKEARAIPGVEIFEDNGGLEANHFGFMTSGHAALYNSAGKLLFNGGITPSRGHQGDNAGAKAVLDLVLRGNSKTARTKVFGCSLQRRRSLDQNI